MQKKKKKNKSIKQQQKQTVIVNIGSRRQREKRRASHVPVQPIYKVTPVSQPNFQSIGEKLVEREQMNKLISSVSQHEPTLDSARQSAGKAAKAREARNEKTPEPPSSPVAAVAIPRAVQSAGPSLSRPTVSSRGKTKDSIVSLENATREKLKGAANADKRTVVLLRPRDDNFQEVQEYTSTLRGYVNGTGNLESVRPYVKQTTLGQRKTFTALFDKSRQLKII
jgi:hypothetical protein